MRAAIIVAGGTGTRINAGIPKQFLLLAGKPILIHTIQNFYDADPGTQLIVVLPKDQVEQWNALCIKHDFKIAHEIVAGGDSRFTSVKNGLTIVRQEVTVVGVHDGVRPFATPLLIRTCFEEAERNGNAIPFIPVRESVRRVSSDQNEVVDRDSIVLIQTPQCFSKDQLIGSYNKVYQPAFTDDASVVENSGYKVHLIPGDLNNIKITFPEDLKFAEALLKKDL